MPLDLDYYGDPIFYGDIDLYHNDFTDSPLDFYAFREVQCHRLSCRITYTPTPGLHGAFKIHSVRPRLSPIRQGSFTHESFVDAITPSQHLAVRITHSGSEFILSHLQLITQRKKKQPVG